MSQDQVRSAEFQDQGEDLATRTARKGWAPATEVGEGQESTYGVRLLHGVGVDEEGQ